MNQAEQTILAWCRKQRAGNACMREFMGKRWVLNVNTSFRNLDGTINPNAVRASGDTWEEIAQALGLEVMP